MMRKLRSVAHQELLMLIKSRWILHYSILFAILALIISMIGTRAYSGYDGFTISTANLLNLSLLLVPLIALLFGSMNWAGEQEDGWLPLLRTYPLSRLSLIGGKYLGLLLGMVMVISIGYAISGFFFVFQGATFPVQTFLTFWSASIILAAIFLAIAIMLGAWSKNRLQAMGTSLIIWAWLLLFYEFFLFILATWLPKTWILPFLVVSLYFNPVELVRSWVILSMGSGILFGPELYSFVTWSEAWVGQLLYLGVAILWIIIPLFFTLIMERRTQDE